MTLDIPVFSERPVTTPLTVDRTGKISAERHFTIIAIDRVVAFNTLVGRGFGIGHLWQTKLGSIISAALRANSIQLAPENREIVGDPDNKYIAVIAYDNDDGGQRRDRNDLELIPDGPAHFSSEASLSSIDVDTDIFGNPIVNSAGVPFADPVSAPTPTQFIIAEWIDSNTNWFAAERISQEFRGRVNSRRWKGAAAGNILCHNILVKALDNEAFSSGGLVKYTGRFEFKPTELVTGINKPGFVANRIDKGRMEEGREVPGELTPILTAPDKNGRTQPVQADVFLDGTGLQLEEGELTVALFFEVIPKVDLNRLRI